MKIPYARLVNESKNLFQTLDPEYQLFMEGVAEGSEGLLMPDDVKVLNAQESLVQILSTPQSKNLSQLGMRIHICAVLEDSHWWCLNRKELRL